MDINEDFLLHVKTIEGWLESCNQEIQLPICEEAVQTFIVVKFTGKVPQIDMEIHANDLYLKIEDQRRKIRYYTEKPISNVNHNTSTAY